MDSEIENNTAMSVQGGERKGRTGAHAGWGSCEHGSNFKNHYADGKHGDNHPTGMCPLYEQFNSDHQDDAMDHLWSPGGADGAADYEADMLGVIFCKIQIFCGVSAISRARALSGGLPAQSPTASPVSAVRRPWPPHYAHCVRPADAKHRPRGPHLTPPWATSPPRHTAAPPTMHGVLQSILQSMYSRNESSSPHNDRHSSHQKAPSISRCQFAPSPLPLAPRLLVPRAAATTNLGPLDPSRFARKTTCTRV